MDLESGYKVFSHENGPKFFKKMGVFSLSINSVKLEICLNGQPNPGFGKHARLKNKSTAVIGKPHFKT